MRDRAHFLANHSATHATRWPSPGVRSMAPSQTTQAYVATGIRRVLSGVTLASILLSPVRVTRADAPCGRYVIQAGTAYDTKTKLTWQQAVPTERYDLGEAQNYCSTLTLAGGGWRLPTIKELFTIVDFRAPGASLDRTAFPNAPYNVCECKNYNYWSSTPVAIESESASAWSLVAGPGGSNYPDPSPTRDLVKCVR